MPMDSVSFSCYIYHYSLQIPGYYSRQGCLNIRGKDFTPSLLYIAVSYIKTLNGLIFNKHFNRSRFDNSLIPIEIIRNFDLTRRQC
jgi:hypothetical protein